MGISSSMKLLSTLPLAALGQSFYDYYDPNSAGKFGALQVVTQGGAADNYGDEGASPNNSGHGGNNPYCHSTGHNQSIYNWTNNALGGYFKDGRNVVECVGEELYCFIEERAQFGQIIGITAGCEQMMNHPAVTIANQQTGVDINAVKNNYNRFCHGGFGQNQWLRFPKMNGSTRVDSPGTLLPFGVSVCRACCVAEFLGG